MNAAAPLQIAIDSSLEPAGEQLELPSSKPFGHFVAHHVGMRFAIVSEFAGELGQFPEQEDAQPFLRMLARDAYLGQRRFDFRLFQWLPEAKAWDVAQRTVELREIPTTKPAPHLERMFSRPKPSRVDRRERACARARYAGDSPWYYDAALGGMVKEAN